MKKLLLLAGVLFPIFPRLLMAGGDPPFTADPSSSRKFSPPTARRPGRAVEPTLAEFLKARGLEGYYASPRTPASERRLAEESYRLLKDPRTSPGYRAALEKRLELRRRRSSAARAKPAGPAWGSVKVYSYPNPAQGRDAVIRVETGEADAVEISARDLSGKEVLKVVLEEGRVLETPEGPRKVYEHTWPVRGLAGVYVIEAVARRAGAAEARGACKAVIVR